MGLQPLKRLPRRMHRPAAVTTAAAGVLMLASCSAQDQAQLERLAMPEPVTDRAPAIYDLWQGSWLAAILVGILVWGLIIYACIAYRRRKGDESVPVQTRYNLPIEVLYTVVPLIMVLVLFYYTVTVQNEVLADEPEPDHTIEVVGFQWSWAFNYVDDQALDGETDVFTVGTTGERPTLVLPVDESVKVQLSSPDVIHSFWVPGFLFKMDVIPGRTNEFSFTPTEEGTYKGRCAELCGVYHSRMLFDVRVVSAEEYAAHLQSLEDAGNVGITRGGADARTKAGQEEEVQDQDTTGAGE